jgi:hypothetical protein
MMASVLTKALRTELAPKDPTDLMPGLTKKQEEAKQEELKASAAVSDLEQKKLTAESQAKAEREAAKVKSTEEATARRTERETPLLEQEKEYGKALMDAHFEPTKENLTDQVALFSLMNILGFAIGAGGKKNAQAAMAAMNGMLEGHQKGREDIYKMERTNFDKNFKALQQRAVFIEKELAKSLQEYARDKDAGDQRANAVFAQAEADFMKKYAEKAGLVKAYELAKEVRKAADKAVEKEEQRKIRNEDKVIDERRRMGERLEVAQVLQSMKPPKEPKAEKQTAAQITAGFGTGPSALVEEFIGDRLPTKQAEPIINAATAIGEAEELKRIVAKTPGIVGREGQVRQFVDRYIKSAMAGKEVPEVEEVSSDPKAQEALRFAKRYASYLVNYERSLAPGSRGFTVYFQRRFNELMSQDQFNAAGMIGLLNDQQKEVAGQATRITQKANIDNLKKLGHDIVSRGDTGESPAPAPAAPAPSPAVEKGRDEKGSFHYEYNADRTKRRKVYD